MGKTIDINTVVFRHWDFKLINSMKDVMDIADVVVKFRKTKHLPYIGNYDHLIEFLKPAFGNPKSHYGLIPYIFQLTNNIEKEYTKVYLPKKNGKYRTINKPSYWLKYIQYIILYNILVNIPVSKYATAFVSGKNILDNAKPHENKKYVIKLDFEDFFTSITRSDLMYYVFDKYPKAVNAMLSTLCCTKDLSGNYYLPQGACTSPYISNIVMRKYDEKIGRYCEKNNIAYTRYADDLTFSGDDINIRRLMATVKRIISSGKYKPTINELKTKVITKGHKQIVTGACVNEFVQAPKEIRKKIRQELYYIEKYGTREHILRTCKKDFFIKDYKSKDDYRVSSARYINHLMGLCGYCLSLNPNDYEINSYIEKLKRIKNKKDV